MNADRTGMRRGATLVLGIALAAGGCNVLAANFGDMMNPSKWFGGSKDRNYDDDRWRGPGYGYGGPGWGYGGPGWGYGGPGWGYGGPGYGYGAPGWGYGAPGYGYGGPAYGAGGPGYGAPADPAPEPKRPE